MAITKITNSDTYGDAFNRYNDTVDKLVTGTTLDSVNKTFTLDLFDATTLVSDFSNMFDVSNGLSTDATSGDYKLGGLLTENTSLDGDSRTFSLTLDTINQFSVDANSIYMSSIGDFEVVADSSGSSNTLIYNKNGVLSGLATGLDTASQAVNWEFKQNIRELRYLTPVKYASTTNLGGNWSGGISRLTATTNGAMIIDGQTPSINDRILLKDQTDAKTNGVFVVSQIGDASNPWILDRTGAIEVYDGVFGGENVYVTHGDTNSGNSYTNSTYFTTSVNVGTDATTWVQTGGGGTVYNSGNGITIDGNNNIDLGGTLDSNVDLTGTGQSFQLSSNDGNYSYTFNAFANAGIQQVFIESSNSSNQSGELNLTPNVATLLYDDSLSTCSVQVNDDGIRIQDEINLRGAIYATDYSGNFVDRSLVDKEYADNTTFAYESMSDETVSFTKKFNSILIPDASTTSTLTLDCSNCPGGGVIKICNNSGGNVVLDFANLEQFNFGSSPSASSTTLLDNEYMEVMYEPAGGFLVVTSRHIRP